MAIVAPHLGLVHAEKQAKDLWNERMVTDKERNTIIEFNEAKNEIERLKGESCRLAEEVRDVQELNRNLRKENQNLKDCPPMVLHSSVHPLGEENSRMRVLLEALYEWMKNIDWMDSKGDIFLYKIKEIIIPAPKEPMTQEEMERRYTPETALDLSVEKWERLGRKENWMQVLRKDKDLIGTRTCSLCKRHMNKTQGLSARILIWCAGINENDPCPLLESNSGTGGCCIEWRNARDALNKGDQLAFAEACEVMVKRMRDAKVEDMKKHMDPGAFKLAPEPKFKNNMRVFSLDLHEWGRIKETKLRREMAYLIKWEIKKANKSSSSWHSESHLITNPTWLEAFGYTVEGRKKLAIELAERGKKEVEYNHPLVGWEPEDNLEHPFNHYHAILVGSTNFLNLHRFKPEE